MIPPETQMFNGFSTQNGNRKKMLCYLLILTIAHQFRFINLNTGLFSIQNYVVYSMETGWPFRGFNQFLFYSQYFVTVVRIVGFERIQFKQKLLLNHLFRLAIHRSPITIHVIIVHFTPHICWSCADYMCDLLNMTSVFRVDVFDFSFFCSLCPFTL